VDFFLITTIWNPFAKQKIQQVLKQNFKFQIMLTGKTLQFGMNHIVSNEMFWYSAQTLKFNWLTSSLTK